ncbi:MAG: CPBP family intramembrane metalloprotease, partial [Lachnospiraceae bacterium]|nr:CPBP family intramembrane metalloprotease [Lachnospiraceae bacterium]
MKSKHRFSDKHPVLSLLIFTFGGFLVSEFVIGIIIMMALKPLGLDTTTGTAIGGSIGAAVVLLVWYRWFSPEYRFLPQKGDIRGSFVLIAPILIYWVLLFGMFGYLAGGIPFRAAGLQTVVLALMAGMVEEVCFREIAISFMAKKLMNEKRIPLMAVASGILFGFTHLTNLVNGNPVTDILYQVILTVLTGVFFAAVYLRRGNVWVVCLVHFAHDLLAFMAIKGVDENGVKDIPNWTAVCIAILEAGL